MGQNEVYQQAIAKYGEENQLFQVCEECAEEIADVEVMIDQLIMILGISPVDVLDIKQSKIKRLAERLKENNS